MAGRISRNNPAFGSDPKAVFEKFFRFLWRVLELGTSYEKAGTTKIKMEKPPKQTNVSSTLSRKKNWCA
jgi:hypothetical protein